MANFNVGQDGELGAEFDFDTLFDAASGWPAADATGVYDQTLALDLGLDGLAGFPEFAQAPVVNAYPCDLWPPAVPDDPHNLASTINEDRQRVLFDDQHSHSHHERRLPDLLEAWMWILHPQHPMIDGGQQILQDFNRFAHLEHSVDLWCYAAWTPEHPRQHLDLTQHVQRDLNAITDLTENLVIADQRATPFPPLTTGSAARAALRSYLPVAFELPHKSERGMRAVPGARVPHYVVQTVEHTWVIGSGTVLGPRRSTARMPTVYHVALGQLVLLSLPLTPANELGPPEEFSLRQRFLWALCQPSAVFRVLYPGDSAFVPAMHWHAMIALGDRDSSFAATLIFHVQRLEEVTSEAEKAGRAHASS